MWQRRDISQAEVWRWEAARLRTCARDVADDLTREQLLVFADDCEEEARRRDGADAVRWRA